MITPVDFNKYPLTQGWGGNPDTYARFGLKGHNGLDIGTPNATDVYAPHAGQVLEVYYDKGGYGTYIKIENDEEGSVLAHLKESHVSMGDTVMEGQLIAKSNNSGFSTGPHLHWGYYRKPRNRQDGYLGYIDPTPYIKKEESKPTESIEDLKKKIHDFEQTEIRLRREFAQALSDKERECQERHISYKAKLSKDIEELLSKS